MPRSRITVTVPEDVLRAADARAQVLDRSRSWVVAEALKWFVSECSQTGGPDGPLASVREPAASYGLPGSAPHGVAVHRGLGPYRQLQLEADLRLTPAERVLESERTGVVAEHATPRGRLARVVTFDRFEDFLEWQRREDLPR